MAFRTSPVCIAQLRPGLDELILRMSEARNLPAIGVESLPEPRRFFAEQRKAGLASSRSRRRTLKVLRYRTDSFRD